MIDRKNKTMKPNMSIYLVFSLALTFVNCTDARNRAIATTKNSLTTIQSEQIYHKTGVDLLLTGGVICPDNTPCREDINKTVLTRVICPKYGSPCYEDDSFRYPMDLELQFPQWSYLRNDRPTFTVSFSSKTDARSYIISLQDSLNKRILELQLPSDKRDKREEPYEIQLPYPKNKEPLERDKYYKLIVEPIYSQDREDKSQPAEVVFKVISEADDQQIEAKVQFIRNQNLSMEETELTIAQLYINEQLIIEAIKILKDIIDKNSQTIEGHQLLGDIYFNNVKDIDLADKYYQQALELAQNLSDQNGQAEAYISLARLSLARLKIIHNSSLDEAINKLKEAHKIYQALNNLELATQLTQFLGEVYKKEGYREEAIYWYQQAKVGYEKLENPEEQQNRLKRVQEELQDLYKLN